MNIEKRGVKVNEDPALCRRSGRAVLEIRIASYRIDE
jgi:hypothetical protein